MKNRLAETLKLSLVYAFGTTLEKLLNLVLIPVYTAFLSTSDYGIIGIMSVTTALLAPFVSGPVSNGLMRFYYSPRFEKNQKQMFFNALLYTIVLSAMVAAAMVIFSNLISDALLGTAEHYLIVRIFAFILFAGILKRVLLAHLRIAKKASLFIFVNTSRILLSGIVIIVLFYSGYGIMALVYGSLFMEAYAVVFLIPYIIRNTEYAIDWSVLRPLLLYGYPLILSTISIHLMQVGDRYVLRYFLGLGTVGIYALGYQVSGIINLFTTPTKFAVSPMIFQQESKPDSLKEYASRMLTYYYAVAITISFGIALFAEEIVSLLARDSSYHPAYVVAPLLILGYVFYGATAFYGKGMLLAGKTIHVSAVYVMVAILNILLNLLFVPLLGMQGAAIATVLSYVVLCSVQAYYSNKFYGLRFQNKHTIQLLTIAVMLYIVSVLLPSDWSLPVKVFILLAFPLLVYSTLDRQDRVLIKDCLKDVKKKGVLETITRFVSRSGK